MKEEFLKAEEVLLWIPGRDLITRSIRHYVEKSVSKEVKEYRKCPSCGAEIEMNGFGKMYCAECGQKVTR